MDLRALILSPVEWLAHEYFAAGAPSCSFPTSTIITPLPIPRETVSTFFCVRPPAEIIQSCYRGFRLRIKLWLRRQREIKRERVMSAHRLSSTILTSFLSDEAPTLTRELVRAKRDDMRSLDERLVEEGSQRVLPSPVMSTVAREQRLQFRRWSTSDIGDNNLMGV